MTTKRNGTLVDSSSRRRTKRRQLGHDTGNDGDTVGARADLRAEMKSFVEGLSRQECTPAWSCTNLIAVPTPTPAPAPSIFGIPHTRSSSPSPLSITVTHFAGTAIPTDRKGKAPQRSRLSFVLSLPATTVDPAARISHLSFAPCGGHILAIVSADGQNDRLTIFEAVDGCIDQWEIVWNESLGRFGESAEGGKKVVDVRWVGEPRRWYPSPKSNPSSKPLFCAPHRSPPIVGVAFIMILSNSTLLFVHIPRALPLIPLTVLISLDTATSATAMSTPASVVASTSQLLNPLSAIDSPQNAMDDLVANLVDDAGRSPFPNAAMNGGDRGADALRDQLRAAKRGGDAKHLTMATIGAARGTQVPDFGVTTFLVASKAASVKSPRSHRKSSIQPLNPGTETASSALQLSSVPMVDESSESGFEMMDFSSFDEAFDEPSKIDVKLDQPDSSSISATPKEAGGRRGNRDEETVEICEVKIEFLADGGPRISIQPLPAMHLSDPAESNTASGSLSHLAWLEDNALPVLGTEMCPDLSLLAIFATPSPSGSLRSTLRVWSLSNDVYSFSEAFQGLECKRSEAITGEREWTPRLLASKQQDGLITLLSSHLAPAFSSFLIGSAKMEEDGESYTEITILDSMTLDVRSEFGATRCLRAQILTPIQISQGRSTLCAIERHPGLPSSAVLAAVPLGSGQDLLQRLGELLSIILIRQIDTSDVVGRILGLKDDDSIVSVISATHSTLQAMLPDSRLIESTPLQLDLLGVSSVLYKASSSLYPRGEIAFDILQLAACVRAFRLTEVKSRGGINVGFQCDADALWPLIGYTTWFCEFCCNLVEDLIIGPPIGNSTNQSSRQILLLHPFPRSLLLLAVDFVLGLHSFLSVIPGNLGVPKNVIDDAIDAGGLSMTDWRSVLIGVAEFAIPTEDLKHVLAEMILPESFASYSTALSTLLSSPHLLRRSTLIHSSSQMHQEKNDLSLPTPPRSPLPSRHSFDVMRRSRLNPLHAIKRCTKCGERVEKTMVNGGAGSWRAFEGGWDVRCLCGGLWHREL